MKILIDVDYVVGRLCSGHYEFNIPDNEIEKWKEYIYLLKKENISEEDDLKLEQLEDDFYLYRQFFIDDYDIDDIGPLLLDSYFEET